MSKVYTDHKGSQNSKMAPKSQKQTQFILRLKFFQSKIFFGPKIIVPKLDLKLEFDTEDQVLFEIFSAYYLGV